MLAVPLFLMPPGWRLHWQLGPAIAACSYIYFCFALLCFFFCLSFCLFLCCVFCYWFQKYVLHLHKQINVVFYTDDKTWNVINVLNVLIILVTQPKMYESNKPFTGCKCNPVFTFFCFLLSKIIRPHLKSK